MPTLAANPKPNFLPPTDQPNHGLDLPPHMQRKPSHDPNPNPTPATNSNFDASPEAVLPATPPPSLLYLSFNQDHSCFAAGTDHGFWIYNCDPFREIFRRDFDHRGGGIDGQLLATASTKGTLVRVYNTVDGSLLQEWLSVSSDKGTVHVFGLKFNAGSPGSVRSQSASEPPHSSLSFIRGVLPKYFSSEWSVAQFRLLEGSQCIVAFGHQKNTVVILGIDGRSQFDPVNGGEMTRLEYHNFVKPDEAF
ncbi:hypothetical protein GOBAR_AA15650 [Gossypium barbadense]|uniref:Uncharacterized protein n=1 Tax=Gossypium barbadense TaxID=3634 RepID=A0A2P5XNW3_GOSBA|nr:hypothetical protein GOBAR_AA15650 [Gossypium barbadense]